MYVIAVYADGHYRLSLASDGCRDEHMMKLDWRHDSDRPFEDDSTIRIVQGIIMVQANQDTWFEYRDDNWSRTAALTAIECSSECKSMATTLRSKYETILMRDLIRCLAGLFNALSWKVMNKFPNACHVISSAEKWSWLLSDTHLNSR